MNSSAIEQLSVNRLARRSERSVVPIPGMLGFRASPFFFLEGLRGTTLWRIMLRVPNQNSVAVEERRSRDMRETIEFIAVYVRSEWAARSDQALGLLGVMSTAVAVLGLVWLGS